MQIKKLTSALLIATFIVPQLYAEECINCVSTIVTNHTQSAQVTTVAFKQTSNLDDTNDYIIPLEDNTIESYQDENSIVVTDEIPEEDIILTMDSFENNIDESKTILACDNSEAPVLMCDDITQECECV